MNRERPYRRTPARRSSRTTETSKTSKTSPILTQSVVCGFILAAVLIFKAVGGDGFAALRTQYDALSGDTLTLTETVAELDQLSEQIAFLGTISNGLKSVFAPVIEGEAKAANAATGNEGSEHNSAELFENYMAAWGTKTPWELATQAQNSPISNYGAGGEDLPVKPTAKTVNEPPEGASFAPYFLTAKLYPPVKYGRITSPYGYRNHPKTGVAGFHRALDIGAEEGEPISSVFSGTVIERGSGDTGYGNYIVVQHAGNCTTLYAHCSEVLANEGDKVRAGEIIALVGSTGDSTGPHVHFELRIDGLVVDPAPAIGGIYDL